MSDSNVVKSVSLYCNTGGSDKVYEMQINEVDGGYMVYFANGRRGAALKPKPKSTVPMSLQDAVKLFDSIYKEKTSVKKGYTECPSGGTLTPSAQSEKDSGIRVQSLNAITESEARNLCRNDAWVAQEKHDGERRPIAVKAGQVEGINRYGEYTGLKSELAGGISAGVDCVIDGEDLGSTIAVFDLLEYNGVDYRNLPFINRYQKLSSIVSQHPALRLSQLACTTSEKLALMDRIIKENREGVVFKRADSTYTEGKPASGGNQLKWKTYTEASVVVVKVNIQRSVQIAVIDEEGAYISVGNVTIPPSADVPSVGAVLELRYLYAYPNGSLFQPVYGRPRPDLRTSDCKKSQLKYKRVEGVEAA
jgi:bifunctional non-homologous end joining protein LigD